MMAHRRGHAHWHWRSQWHPEVAVNCATRPFAYTYATGMAWDWYFMEVRKGHVPQPEQLQDVFRQQLARGASLWQTSEEQAGAEAE